MSKFKVGDRVKFNEKTGWKDLIGYIGTMAGDYCRLDRPIMNSGTYFYEIRIIDETCLDIIMFENKISDPRLGIGEVKIPFIKIKKTCTCGTIKCGGGIHSDWCDIISTK